MNTGLTLIIDGNWLLMSRMSVMQDKFRPELPADSLEAAKKELKSRMKMSISKILKTFSPDINNLIVVRDGGGSWRNEITRPKSLSNIIYKGNRKKNKIDLAWEYIYSALDNVLSEIKELGLTVSYAPTVEGDDWIWYWTTYLYNLNQNSIIWTADQDLQQLIKYNKKTDTVTCWYNDKTGLVLPIELAEKKSDTDILNFFENISICILMYEKLKNRVATIIYIDPVAVLKKKILCGDVSDNIKAAFLYERKGRFYGIGKTVLNNIIEATSDFNAITPFCEKSWEIISSNKAFANKMSKSTFIKRLKYNIKLIWLNKKMYPQNILSAMSTHHMDINNDVSGILNFIKNNWSYAAINVIDDYDQKELDDIFLNL